MFCRGIQPQTAENCTTMSRILSPLAKTVLLICANRKDGKVVKLTIFITVKESYLKEVLDQPNKTCYHWLKPIMNELLL
jgi:hypothetical protein